MKKFYFSNYFIASLIFSFALFGCKKYLSENPIDQLNEKQAYSNPTLIYLNSVVNLYTQIGGKDGGKSIAGTDRGLYDLQTFTNDEAILPTRGGDWYDGGLWQDLFKQQWTASNGILKGTWDYLYGVIGQCNQSLDKLTQLQQADPENISLPIYIAEVRAIRAMYYYYLLDLFARVPIVTSSTTAIADVKQSERNDVFQFVVKEFQDVFPLLSPNKSNLPGEYYGRITRPVAFMFLAKLALNAQVYSDNHWEDNNGIPNGTTDFLGGYTTPKTCWDATIDYCDSIGKYGYSLEPDFSKNFAVANETSVENIFTIPMDPILYPNNRFMYNVRTMHYDHAKAFKLDGWNGASLTKTGLNIFGYNMTNEDPRLLLSFFTGAVNGPDGQPVLLDGTTPLVYVPDAVAIDVSGTTDEKTAGARWHKYEIDKNALAAGQLVSNDYVIFRYADVLLMRAEALTRNGGSGATELTTVRNRVASTATGTTLQDILDERFKELSWEGVRRQDLVRFGKFHIANADRTTTSSSARCVFLIPAEVLAVNTNLTQNPTD